MTPSPEADHYAAAIVAACRETGEDPTAIAQGADPSRARSYAYAAIRSLFQRPTRPDVMRLLGAPDPSRAVERFSPQRAQAKWWDEGALGRVVDAVRRVRPAAAPAPTAAVPLRVPQAAPTREEFTTDVAPRPAPRRREQDHWTAQPPRLPRRAVDATAEICGDPAPGRSALDRRRAEQAAAEAAPDAAVPPLTSARIASGTPHASDVHSVDRQEP